MSRVIIQMPGGEHVNIPGTRIEKTDCYLEVYDGERLVGMFDFSVILCAHISEKGVNK